MLTIILGIALVIILAWILFCFSKNGRVFSNFALLLYAILVITTTIGVGVPVSGYNDWKLIEETELIALANEVNSTETGEIYLSISAENVYTYKCVIGAITLTNEDVEVIEDSRYEVPFLRVYKRIGKKSIWTFALGMEETKYIFYVPEGSIFKEINLN